MAATTLIEKGSLIADKYRVIRELGRGGMAAVYEAENIDIQKRVAIKLLAGHLLASPSVVERFVREARAAAAIRSPHICDIYDAGKTDDDVPFLVLELIAGESLYDRMLTDRQMTVPFTLTVILQVCRGLAKAHEARIVHRDLKPENIQLTEDQDGQLLVKILDFGLAKFAEDAARDAQDPKQARLTRDGAVFGTPTYMSPEQVRGQATADIRADLWALACITYECLTGTTVWDTDEGVAMTFARIASSPLPDPKELRPDLPASFVAWFNQALSRDIDERFQTVDEFARALATAFGYQLDDEASYAALIDRLLTAPAQPAPSTEGARASSPSRPSNSKPDSAGGDSVDHGRAASGNGISPPIEPADLSAPARPWLSRRTAKLLAALVIVSIIAGAGIWRLSYEPPELPPIARFGDLVLRIAKTIPEPGGGLPAVTSKRPWMRGVRQAQALFARADPRGALTILQRAFDQSGHHGMVKNLLAQAQVALLAKNTGAPCQVTGYARPRRYDLITPGAKPSGAGRPTIASGPQGAVIAWTDGRGGATRAYAVGLDAMLRNRRVPQDVTPDGASVHPPVLLSTGKRMLLTYADSGGDSPGVYVRWLTADGANSAGQRAPQRVANRKPGGFGAIATKTPAGHWLVAWSDPADNNSVDLFYRRLNATAEPVGEPVRITDFAGEGFKKSRVRAISVAAVGSELHFVYGYIREPLLQVRYQTIPTDTAPPGLGPLQPGLPLADRTLGSEHRLSPATTTASEPTIACGTDSCYVAWHHALGAGITLGLLDPASGELRWHRKISKKGGHPVLGLGPSGQARLAWYESGRLVTALVGPKGIGPVSRVARVVGEHPPPTMAAGTKPGQWYLSWLDFEAGHLEPYAVRIRCR